MLYPPDELKLIKESDQIIMLDNYKDIITPADLQDILKLGRNKVYELLKSQQVKSVKIGNRYIITKFAVLQFLGIYPINE